MSEVANSVFYTAVSKPIRRLYRELQALASSCGFLDPARAATGCAASSVQHNRSCDSWISGTPGGSLLSAGPSWAGSDLNSSAKKPQEASTICQTTTSWIFATSVTLGACTAGGAALLTTGISFAHISVAAPAITVVVMAGCWLIAWGALELTVHCCAKRIFRLLTNLHFQHKISRETIRWVQELEVTFKALSLAPSRPQQTAVGSSKHMSQGPCKDRSASKVSSMHSQMTLNFLNTQCCGANYCWKNTSETAQECIHQSQEASPRRDIPAGPLRVRFCQVLEWQQDILCRLYEDIMRPTAAAHAACWRLISQGPWKCGRKASGISILSDSSVRALKDTTARSWAVHSRLSAGLQIVLRQLLLSIESRLQRGHLTVRPRRGLDEGRLQPVAVCSRESTRRPVRTVHKELMTLQQKSSTCVVSQSLSDEVAQAGMHTNDTSKAILTNSSGKVSQGSCPASQAHERRNHGLVGPTPTASYSLLAVSGGAWNYIKAFSISRFARFTLFKGFALVRAACDGIAVAWWLVVQLNRLAEAISAADLVAEETARALRIILEEDWVYCPVSFSQPHRALGRLQTEQNQDSSGSVKEASLHLVPCSVVPPLAAFQPFSTVRGTGAPARRIALASMSRQVAASLALLRLPMAFCGSSGKQHLSSGFLGETGSWSPCPLRTNVSEGSDGSANACELAVSAQGKCSDDAALYSFLGLALRHLRAACEEGERLQQSLRSSGQAVEVVRVSPSRGTTPDKAPRKEEAAEQLDEMPQQLGAEPVQYLEVYTAVGQDCSSNKSKCQEEAALLAAFSGEDPAMRERSQLILSELESRLQSHKLELQSVPCVFKNLSAVVPSTAEGVCLKEDGGEGIISITATDIQASTNSSVSHGCTVDGQSDGSQASSVLAAPCPGPDTGRKESEASLFASRTADSIEDGNLREEKGVVRLSSLASGGDFVSCSKDLQGLSTEGDREWLHSELSSFGLHQQKLCGSPSASWRQSPEAMASRSLISQLQGVLTEQRRSVGSGKGPQGVAAQNEGPAIFGDTVDDDDWDSCDVVEGQSCDAKAPLWVAAPVALEDTEACTTENQNQGSDDCMQD